MPIDKTAFGGGATDTLLGAGVLILMSIAVLLMFAVPRRFIAIPLLLGIFLCPSGQTIVIGGIHLFVTRILILAGLFRALASRPARAPLLGNGFTSIDKIFVVWTVFRASSVVLTYREMGALINQLGFIWDVLGGYLLVRMLIRTDEDILRVTKFLCRVAVILAATMLYEKVTGVNVYGFIAGYQIVPEVRNGSIRAQGPFHHAILAGTFGATLIPLFFWLWKNKSSRLLGALGMGASTAITLSAASSTPVAAYLAGILGIGLWFLRKNMRLILWAAVIGILLLNFIMHAPVWWALEHVDFAGGSAGEHRAELIDNFVRHFSDWWLIGTKDNPNWGYEMWDISNQYVAEGECGGLFSFACIIAVITLNFKRIGTSRKFAQDKQREWYFWLLGAAFFSHAFAFLGISYFDQMRYAWYVLLAMITTATTIQTQTRETPANGTSRHTTDLQLREVIFASAPSDAPEEQTLEPRY